MLAARLAKRQSEWSRAAIIEVLATPNTERFVNAAGVSKERHRKRECHTCALDRAMRTEKVTY